MDDVQSKLAELTALVEGARAMPMSASCVLNRGEALALLGEVEALLPRALMRARAVLDDSEGVVEQGRQEARRIVAEAEQERRRLLSETDVYAEAQVEVDRMRAEAAASAETMRVEVEDYVDGKLANFEIVLTKTLAAVERGRQKLAGKHELDDLARPDDQVDGFLEEPMPG